MYVMVQIIQKKFELLYKKEYSDNEKDSKFVFINEPLMSNNGTCNFITNEFINQTAKRVSSHREMCR